MSPNYTQSFVAASLEAVNATSLLVGGDGRFFCPETVQIIIKLAAAKHVKSIYVAKDCILSTPAASHLIRTLSLSGGFLLTASHNPGGAENDFGIKYNCENGGPAPEKLTNEIYRISKSQTSYLTADLPDIDLSIVDKMTYSIGNGTDVWNTTVFVIDGVSGYCDFMQEVCYFNSRFSISH